MPILARNVDTEQEISFADIIREVFPQAVAEVAAEARAAGISLETRDLNDIVQIYMTQHDERVRPSHAALHATEWRPLDPNAPIPPLDWGCRCFLVYRARNPAAAKRTGLPLAPKRSPEPGDEAFQAFFKGAKTSTESPDPGQKVTPQMILGKQSGDLLVQGKINVSDIFDQNLITRNATTLRNIAEARAQKRSVTAVTAATVFLSESFGLSSAVINRAAREAIILKQDNPKLTDLEAVIETLIKTKPGFIGTGRVDSTLRRATIAAKRILIIVGALDGR